jgi:uncharacterized membrane protein YgdD (TMEM256/DUF423 family)
MTWQRAVGGLSCASSIVSGAYGAHGLKKQVGVTDVQVKQWETANRYQFLHSMALVAVPAVIPPAQKLACQVTSVCFAAGTTLFSGGVYGKVLLQENDMVGKAAPVGGGLLIMGWISLALLRR